MGYSPKFGQKKTGFIVSRYRKNHKNRITEVSMVALSQTPFHPSPTLDRRAPELSVHLLSVVFKAIRRPAGFVSKDAQRGHGEYEASKMVSFIKNHEKCIKMVVFHRLAMKNGALDLLSCCSRFYH